MDKLIRFIKNWILPVAIFTGSVLYLNFAFVPAIAGAASFFKPIMASLLPMFMFFTLFVVFYKVDFNKLRPVRWHADSIPFFMRRSQWKFLQTIDKNTPYYIARVFLGDNNAVKIMRISVPITPLK